MEEVIEVSSICCAVCGITPAFRCSRCRSSYYCGKDHQKEHWASHKTCCSPHVVVKSKRAVQNKPKTPESFPSTYFSSNLYILDKREYRSFDQLCSGIIVSLQVIGFCVIENIIKESLTHQILKECIDLYEATEYFTPGQVGHYKNRLSVVEDGSVRMRDEHIRGDKVTWIEDGNESAPNVCELMKYLDELALHLSLSRKFSDCNIKSRTRAMISCYPGNNTVYKMHVDNPNRDGRRITFVYYLNKGYRVDKNGGVLRIRKGRSKHYDIEPRFGRLLIFWSDKRTVHEILPCFTPRFAISVWYFDADERASAAQRLLKEEELNELTCICVSHEIEIASENGNQNE